MKKFAIHHCNTINIDTKSKEDNISNQNMDKKTDKDKNNTGTKRKIQFSRQKKWNRLPPTEPLIVISHKQGNNEKIKNIETELERLQLINTEYDRDYQREKKKLTFNLYEKQYLLDTKTMYHNNQRELINNIKIECENLQSVVKMYNNRIDSNNVHILSLTHGADIMKEHISNMKEEAQRICENMDILEDNRKSAMTRNYEMRNKYISLLKEVTAHQNRANITIDNEKQVTPLFHIIKEANVCGICMDSIGKDIYSCEECVGLLCKFCAEKVPKCPFCGIEKILKRNKFIESLFKAVKEGSS